MEAGDLMISDWVLHEGKPYQIRQLGIYGVDRDGEDYPAVCIGKPTGIGLIVERNEIEPIPLSPEILEKNGWTFNNAETWIGGGLLLQSVDDYAYRIVVNSDCNYEATNDTPFIILYVHELQHALKLCRIRKEIIL